MNMSQGKLFVLSGPSAVGKGSLCRLLLERDPELTLSVSATTRAPRSGEIHGKEYFFYNEKDFEGMIRQDSFLEWAKVYDHYYGTPKAYVDEILNSGKDCILEIDVQGALQIKKRRPGAVLIFIKPPSREALAERIRKRGTENSDEIQKRVSQADSEMSYQSEYRHVVVNDDLLRAADEVQGIMNGYRQEENG
ncbi:MAG: guanylate kinase [Peptococcaceae bacterium]|jgi:guanylate kinase|nr:guanylate kinase [Peptococcaceae bacterium]